ncbi:MAG TPA: PspC domain-containing protein [Candidatus Limnocylindrales bacterium]|nr:PspC domain-containing protein [Candidatus Limnocylindrales bacterium]
MNPRRLYRCRHDRHLAGVASGIAEYLDLDPTLVRVLWILSVFFGGFTILLYIILAFVMPLEPAGPVAPFVGAEGSTASPDGTPIAPADPVATSAWIAPASAGHAHRVRGEGRLGFGLGVLLIVFGGIALLGAALPGWAAGVALGPAFLVALGIAFLVVATRRPAAEP